MKYEGSWSLECVVQYSEGTLSLFLCRRLCQSYLSSEISESPWGITRCLSGNHGPPGTHLWWIKRRQLIFSPSPAVSGLCLTPAPSGSPQSPSSFSRIHLIWPNQSHALEMSHGKCYTHSYGRNAAGFSATSSCGFSTSQHICLEAVTSGYTLGCPKGWDINPMSVSPWHVRVPKAASLALFIPPSACLPPIAFLGLHTEPWGTPVSTQATFWGVSGAHTSCSISQTELRWLCYFALSLVLQTLPFIKVWHQCWGHMVPFSELIILQPAQWTGERATSACKTPARCLHA